MRVVLADDAAFFRETLATALGSAGFEIVGQAGDVTGLLGLVRTSAPDVAIIDIRMPPTNTTEGLDAAARIRADHPGIGLLILSNTIETRHVLQLLRDAPEGIGYLLKDRVGDVEDFVSTLRRVANGGSALDPTVVSRLLAARTDNGPLEPLTPREREVLQLVAEGLSNRAVAERLGITLGSAEKYVSGIFTKLGLPDTGGEYRRVLAVLRFLQA